MEQPSKQGALGTLLLCDFPNTQLLVMQPNWVKWKKRNSQRPTLVPGCQSFENANCIKIQSQNLKPPHTETLTRVPKSLPASKCVNPNRNPNPNPNRNPTPAATKLNKTGAPKTKVTSTMQIPSKPNTRILSPCTQTPIRAPKSQTVLAQTQTQTQTLLQSNWINLKLPKL